MSISSGVIDVADPGVELSSTKACSGFGADSQHTSALVTAATGGRAHVASQTTRHLPVS